MYEVPYDPTTAVPPGHLRVRVLGCGGSTGVPVLRAGWGRCDPTNPRNRRRRAALLLETATTIVLVDTPPDLREQLLETAINRIDAVILTHDHADHVHGIDDLRPYQYGRPVIPVYVDAPTKAVLERRFDYLVDSVDVDRGLYKPVVSPRLIPGSLTIGDISIQTFTQSHGPGVSLGLRVGPFAYSTDVNALDDTAFSILDGVGLWLVDATREAPHPSHAHLARTLSWIRRVRPQRAYLTHMNMDMDYDVLAGRLPDGVAPAFDGLTLLIPVTADKADPVTAA